MNQAELRKRKRYFTKLGAAYQGDALDLITGLSAGSVNAIITSPPFALTRKKAYGNPPAEAYVAWFRDFAREFRRVLTDDGSLVVEIGGAWLPGSPTRSIYQFELLISLVRDLEFHLAEEFYWHNSAKLPGPAQWVNIERIRVKDAVSPIWWLSKTEHPKANNLHILRPYSESQLRLFASGYNDGPRPSGHVIGGGFDVQNAGAIPSNLIQVANTRSSDPYQSYCRARGLTVHPARFPREIPEFFVKFLTEPGDVVLDPFGGSNITGAVAEALERRWITFELYDEYLEGSIGRFAKARLASPFNPGTLGRR